MKKTVLAAVVAMCLAGAGFGQSATVSVQNEENAPFYYVVDPADLAGLTAGSPLMASRVASFFASKASEPRFQELTPGAEASITSLSDGMHLLVGFFAVSDLEEFPVRVISLQADSRIGERFYAIFASPAQLTVPRATGRLAGFPRTLGQQAAGTQSTGGSTATSTAATAAARLGPTGLPEIASFAAGYDPVAFTSESKEGFSVLPIAASRGWPLTGTRVSAVSGLMENGGLRLALTVRDGFSEKVSYFLYIFETRAEGKTNTLTLEIEPRADGSRGACILWRKDLDGPRLVGTVKTTGDTAEVTIGSGDLGTDASSTLGPAASIDLTSAWYDRALGTWEEFYYTTLAVADLPTTR